VPAGILQPGGPGTEIFVYDHFTGAADPVNGYTFAEINAAWPNDFELVGGLVSGVQWGGPRVQYLCRVRVTIGGQNGDGTAATFLQGTNCDVYFGSGGSLNYRTIGYSNGLFQTKFGTRVASAVGGVSGYDGVDIMTRTNMVFRGPVFLYGSEVYAQGGNIQFINPNVSEIAGCIFRTNQGYVIGNDSTPNLEVFNTTFASSTVGAVITTMSVKNSDNFIVAALTPTSFIATGALNLKLRGGLLVGAPTFSDFNWSGASAGAGWIISDTQFSETAGIPRFRGNFGGPLLSTPTKETWSFDVKVTNLSGLPLLGVPVRLESDIEGVVVDTTTLGDGNIAFTNGTIGISSAVLVRDHYNSGGFGANRDRVFTLYVNQAGGVNPPVAGYGGRVLTFEWPGKEWLAGAYEADGGSFKKIVMPITLGPPGSGAPNLWTECDINA
jgi:hypothetical protein